MTNTAQQLTVYQLADDTATYGPEAGRFIVTGDDLMTEHTGPMSQKDAERFASIFNALLFVRNWFNDNGLAEEYHAICEHMDEELAATAGKEG